MSPIILILKNPSKTGCLVLYSSDCKRLREAKLSHKSILGSKMKSLKMFKEYVLVSPCNILLLFHLPKLGHMQLAESIDR